MEFWDKKMQPCSKHCCITYWTSLGSLYANHTLDRIEEVLEKKTKHSKCKSILVVTNLFDGKGKAAKFYFDKLLFSGVFGYTF